MADNSKGYSLDKGFLFSKDWAKSMRRLSPQCFHNLFWDAYDYQDSKGEKTIQPYGDPLMDTCAEFIVPQIDNRLRGQKGGQKAQNSRLESTVCDTNSSIDGSIEDKVDGSIEGSIHKLSQYKLSQDKPSQVYLTSAKTPLPPTYDMVLAYARTRGREDIAKEFYDINSAYEWYDNQGKPISNWKRWFDGYAEKHPVKARYGNFDVNKAFDRMVERSMREVEEEEN